VGHAHRSFLYWTLLSVVDWRLNRAVNLPSQYLAHTGSGLDRLKMEALSWGAT
jgi:hypothetical protein